MLGQDGSRGPSSSESASSPELDNSRSQATAVGDLSVFTSGLVSGTMAATRRELDSATLVELLDFVTFTVVELSLKVVELVDLVGVPWAAAGVAAAFTLPSLAGFERPLNERGC